MWPPLNGHMDSHSSSFNRGFRNCFRKRSELYKTDNFWAFVGVRCDDAGIRKPPLNRGLGGRNPQSLKIRMKREKLRRSRDAGVGNSPLDRGVGG